MVLRSTAALIITFVFLAGPALSQTNGNDPYELTFITPDASQTSGASQPETDNELSEPQPLPSDGGPNCQCVEYYLCNAYGTIITNGEGGLFDVRMGNSCPGEQVCCEIRQGEITPGTELPSSDSTELLPSDSLEPPSSDSAEPPSSDSAELPSSGSAELPSSGSAELPSSGSAEPPPPGSCGIRGGSLNPTRLRKFSEDNVTEFGEFPWMLALLWGRKTSDGNTQYSFHCGASLIHPQVALTAAHDVNSFNESEFKIRAGEWDTQTQTEPLPYQERGVLQIIVHPEYHIRPRYNDIALLILDSPLTMAANVLPICLPEQDAVFDGRRCLVTGWGVGAFEQGAKSETTLRKAELPIVPSADCQKKYRQVYQEELGKNGFSFFRLHDSFMCAGDEPGKDGCKGNIGGPLVCQLPSTSTYVQVGIASWGYFCFKNIPGVYTNVAQFRDWIDCLLNNMTP